MLTVAVAGIGVSGADPAHVAALSAKGVPIGAASGPSSLLPPTERRRAGPLIRTAVEVAERACIAAGLDPAELATVFASSMSEASNFHAICESLSAADPFVSPTRFTNSVHNAASGYWHIAAKCRAAGTSLAAGETTFVAGLVEAAAQCVDSGRPVLLVACDTHLPEPLHSKRPRPGAFAVAFVLCPAGGGRNMTIRLADDEPSSFCEDAGLEALRSTVPAARALPLLFALATPGSVTIDGVSIEVAP